MAIVPCQLRTLRNALSRPVVLGMVHCPALPGTPLNQLNINDVVQRSVADATNLLEGGVDGLVVENMNDLPYVRRHEIGPETTAFMTRICLEVKSAMSRYENKLLGVQVLAGCNLEALSIAHCVGADFIRAEGFVFSHVADEGFIDSTAARLLRYRKAIGAYRVAVYTDIKKKHCAFYTNSAGIEIDSCAHAITSDVSLVDSAKAALFCLADGLILTGAETGSEASPLELEELITKLPVGTTVVVGSGVTDDNFAKYSGATAHIIGSHFKFDGNWRNAVSRERVEQFMNALTLS